ncbi:MAG: S8 family serine peptidase [Flavobacteriales bacterium]|nr:S8 family serine peptidase [Flavobacteriales bacterium]
MRSLLFCSALLFTWIPELRAQAVAIPGDLLIMLNPGASAQKVAEDLREWHGAPTGLVAVREVSAPMRTWLLHFDPARADQSAMLRAVRSHKDVMLAQNNHHLELRELPNDPQYGQQWHHQNINSEGAWDISTGGLTADGDTIVVCIIENCDMPHPDLIDNAWFNHAEVPNNGIDDDANGYVDDYRGWNANADNDQVYGGSHGTQVAGMIGATGNNSVGVVGANWNVKMMVVFNSGANDAGVLASHSYPLTMRRLYNDTEGEKGAFVVATNASWGINGGQPADAPIWCAMYDSLGSEGVLNCGATANNNVNVDLVGDLPTACPSDFMISVTATDVDDERTFSAYGLTTIDVGAPGEDVYTTRINDNYGSTSGTSFASPLTAGVIGLLYSAPCASMMTLVKGDPEQGALYIRDMLFQGVDQVGNLPGQTVTGGRINAGSSMQLIMNGCGTCPAPYNPAVQTVTINSALLTWQSVSGEGFDLRYRPTGAPEWNEVNGITGTSLLVEDLEGCTPYEFQVTAHCGEETSDFSTLFTWTSEGCCLAPTGLNQGFVGEDIVNIFWTSVLAADSYEVRYAPIGTTDFTEVAGIPGNTFEITPLEPCSQISVQVRTVCDGVPTDWSAAVTMATTGCGACTDLVYCATDGGDTGDEWIANVLLGDIDHDSGAGDGYSDHTDVSTELAVGMTHTIRLSPGFSGFQFNEWFHVWIDLDQNGTFDGPDELVFDSGDADNAPVEGPLVIPANTTLGATRMRVIMQYNAEPGAPCAASFDYGEVEDYCVTFTANPGQGIEQDTLAEGLLVFPQPATSEVTIRSAERGGTLTVFDAMGRDVVRTRMVGTVHQLDISDLASGTYAIVVDHGRGAPQRGRLVVARTR